MRETFSSTAERSPQRKWGPASLPPPTIRFRPRPGRPLHPEPLFWRSAVRKTLRRGVSRNDPAAVWPGPFRGPASPGKPFVILSGHLSKQLSFSGDGLLSNVLTGFAATRGNCRVTWSGHRSIKLSVHSVLFRLVLQPPLMSRRFDFLSSDRGKLSRKAGDANRKTPKTSDFSLMAVDKSSLGNKRIQRGTFLSAARNFRIQMLRRSIESPRATRYQTRLTPARDRPCRRSPTPFRASGRGSSSRPGAIPRPSRCAAGGRAARGRAFPSC